MLHGAKCGKVRGWMADAASGSLSESRRGEFEAHIGDCAACRAEFQRTEKLLGKIDQNLRAALAVEPSPQLLANVRQSIAAEPQRSRRWLTRNVWVTAGASAALAVLLIAVMLHRRNSPQPSYAPRPVIANAAPAHAPAAPSHGTSVENIPLRPSTRVHSSKPQLAVARQELATNPRRHAEPEVIVQPGQMQAILQFVAETRDGKINGGEIEEGIKAAEKPLGIKPLDIAPLETSQGDKNEDPTAKSREPGSSNGRSE